MISLLSLWDNLGWKRGTGDWIGVSGAIAAGEKIQVIQEVGARVWMSELSCFDCFILGWESSVSVSARVWISFTQRSLADDADFPKVQFHPRVLWIGVGFNDCVCLSLIEEAINLICRKYHLALLSIAGIATIDDKVSNGALYEICQANNWELKFFASDQLRCISVPNPSELVNRKVNTVSVAEAAAILASSNSELLVKKQVVTWDDVKGGVTLAIAVQSDDESN